MSSTAVPMTAGAPARIPDARRVSACRSCGAPLGRTVIDLGDTPLANSYLRPADLSRTEARFPLRAVVCDSCLLVQLDHIADASAIFSEYAYVSSYSETWLEHARLYVAHMVDRLALDASSRVVEIVSNDG